jgi:5-methylcytosine-specific restriction enzyme subunit McrC
VPNASRSFPLVEYGPPTSLIGDLAVYLGTSLADAEQQLRKVGERLQAQHSLTANPIEINSNGVSAKRVAGTVAICRDAELEIRPKFAGPRDDWQEDLLFLALFTVYGHVDLIRTIAAATTSQNTMADLVGRILLGLIHQNGRRPLKTRRASTVYSWEPFAELDLEAKFNPEDNGWPQRVYQMGFDNQWWATIHAGIQALLPHLRDPSIRSGLTDLVSRWGRPSTAPSFIRQALPPRFATWQSAYDLAFELIRGSSTAPSLGPFATFGFTIDTWRTWEALLERALVMAVGASRVALQASHPFGAAAKNAQTSALAVFPDAVVTDSQGLHIIDAKYKGRHERGFEGISATDRYEILAFMHAVGTDRATLLYPSLVDAPVGTAPEELEVSTIPMGTIRALALGIGGIGKPAGLHKFIRSVAAAVGLPISSAAAAAAAA